MKKNTQGFTLVEILLFVTLLSLVFVGISFLATFSLTTSRISQQKVVATHYAEELQEWLRGEKEVDWNTFLAVAGTPTGITYCVESIPSSVSLMASGSCGSSYNLDSQYKREVTLTKNVAGTQVTAAITVSWNENNNSLNVPVTTIFSVWE